MKEEDMREIAKCPKCGAKKFTILRDNIIYVQWGDHSQDKAKWGRWYCRKCKTILRQYQLVVEKVKITRKYFLAAVIGKIITVILQLPALVALIMIFAGDFPFRLFGIILLTAICTSDYFLLRIWREPLKVPEMHMHGHTWSVDALVVADDLKKTGVDEKIVDKFLTLAREKEEISQYQLSKLDKLMKSARVPDTERNKVLNNVKADIEKAEEKGKARYWKLTVPGPYA